MEILCNSYTTQETVDRPWVEIEINDKKYDINLSTVKTSILLDQGIDFSIDYQCIESENKSFYLFTRNDRLYLTAKLNKIWQRKSNLHSKITRKNIVLYGKYTDISNEFPDCDNVYVEDDIVTKIHRPFKKGPFKNFAIIKIPIETIKNNGKIHSRVAVGDPNNNKVELTINKKHEGMNYFSQKRLGGNYFLVRSVINSAQIKIVNILMSPEYKKINLFKNAVARFLGKIIGHTNSVLMFEKETKKANESGYYVFEKIMELEKTKSKVFFVIDKNCKDFAKVYNKYPKNTIKKYSFKHYLYLYISKYFISSELSNHVINPRLYIKSINKELAKKPLIFLQHGIMFSKPVNNPAAAAFKKENSTANYYKSVVSSDLEATQFYACGFKEEDLIKCGLPKFDISRMNDNADKILVMLTYRYWEEALVMNPQTITKTSYYQTYMRIIDSFKKAGLLDKLLISCHPKFADCLITAAPEYTSIIEKDINKALENSRIFITDYSSASYDAHYRGAYIIYYWAERDFLIENYKSVPPINEENCDGVPVFSDDELIYEVNKAIENNYVMDEMYHERYKKINEFDDNQNGKRIIDELLKLNII